MKSVMSSSPPASRRLAAERLFFPLAAAYAALAVPLSLHGMLSGRPLLAGLSSPLMHAHELLFGFALAVVAGYLINRLSLTRLLMLGGLWLLARILFLTLPGSLPALMANIAFAAVVAAFTAPQFMRAAKRLRNHVFGPVLIALALAVAAYHLLPALGVAPPQIAVHQTLLLFGLLMVLMGGRIIAPAVAGAIERGGGTLEARVQPRIEGILIVLMLAALGASLFPGGTALAGGLLLLAGPLTAVRLIRWRPWQCRQRWDLLCLMLGYAWLSVSLTLLGMSHLSGSLPPAIATHGLTVGAMGTLTATVMARVRLVRRKLDPAQEWSTPVVALAISAAAVLRIGWPASPPALWLAAGLWTLAFILLLGLFARVPAR